MKILVFEYITGGGFNERELPEALLNEGLMMLQALLDQLAALDFVETAVLMDGRVATKVCLTGRTEVIQVGAGQNALTEFREQLNRCEAVWPIAPETDDILAGLCRMVEKAGKILLTSSAEAVTLAGNKWLTYQLLRNKGVNTVDAFLLGDFNYLEGEWLVKPVDGVGCENSFVLTTESDYSIRCAGLDPSRYLVQPHLPGLKTSLSCLFRHGQGWLLTVNRQEFVLVNQRYHLTQIQVNIDADHARYQPVVAAVAAALPALWGYGGIDLIETGDEFLVLEINPRLTTSFAGIQAATGLNIGALALQLSSAHPAIHRTHSRTITLTLDKDEGNYAA